MITVMMRSNFCTKAEPERDRERETKVCEKLKFENMFVRQQTGRHTQRLPGWVVKIMDVNG